MTVGELKRMLDDYDEDMKIVFQPSGEMENLILKHNRKVKKDTEKAVEVLKANGFKIVSERFAALS